MKVKLHHVLFRVAATLSRQPTRGLKDSGRSRTSKCRPRMSADAEKYAGMSLGETSKVLAEAWKALSDDDKAPYQVLVPAPAPVIAHCAWRRK